MVIQFLKTLTESYKWLPEAAAIIGVILLIFKRGRKWIVGFAVGLYTWIVFPFKSQDIRSEILSEISSVKIELKKNTKISEETAREVSDLKSLVGHNGGGGLLDMVGELVGWRSSEFWTKNHPGFLCDENGDNLDVTHSYCILLGVSSKIDLTGMTWKSFFHRDELRTYLLDFKEACARRESFRSRVELFSVHGASQGFWIIGLHPISAEKAKIKRYVGMLYPSDETSMKMAVQYSWPLVMPT